jgi:biopolymer transport protein ExbB/TolQ
VLSLSARAVKKELSMNLSPLQFFILAGPVGKAVLLLLLVASVWCWVIIIEASINLVRFKGALRRWQAQLPAPMLTSLIEAGTHAAHLAMVDESTGERRLRIIEAMNRRARLVIGATEGGLANLAVISSVAPFVGLFGTVWGIMTSFTAIAAAKDTSLAVVAPGIAEALATTAFGLAAAIPASIGYTRLGSAITHASEDLASQIEEAAVRAVLPAARPNMVRDQMLKEAI